MALHCLGGLAPAQVHHPGSRYIKQFAQTRGLGRQLAASSQLAEWSQISCKVLPFRNGYVMPLLSCQHTFTS